MVTKPNRVPGSPGNAAKALGVNLLITGRVEKNGDRFRVRADVKDATTLKSLRSQTLEVAQAERVTLEDALLERVARLASAQCTLWDAASHAWR